MPLSGTPEPEPNAPMDVDALHADWCHVEGYIHTRVTVNTVRRPGETYADFEQRHQIRVDHAVAINPPNCTEHN
jgi:hypothetical protein